MTTSNGKYKIIQSVARAFAIIDCFTVNKTQLTLNEIAKQTDLNINTTRGLVQTLLHFNYLAYDEVLNTYRLGLVFIEKAEIAHFEFTKGLIDLVRSDLQRLADEYFVSVRMMSVEDIQASTIWETKPSRSRYALVVHESTEFPLYASATGKLILAHLEPYYRNQVIDNFEWKEFGRNTLTSKEALLEELDKVRQADVAVESEELGIGFSSLAVPVFHEGELIYSLSVTTTANVLQDKQADMVADLNKVRAKIAEGLQQIA